MENFPERGSLEEESKRLDYSKCRKRSLFGIVFAIIFVVLIVIIVPVVYYFQERNFTAVHYLNDVLPKSFYIELDIYNQQERKWIKDDNLKYYIEWDIEQNDLRYLKTMSVKLQDENGTQTDSQKSSDMLINIYIVNDEAVSSLFDKDNSMTSCHNDVYADGFYYIIQMASNATLKSGLRTGVCDGRIWSYPNCNGEISFCEKNSKLVYIIQGDMRADIVKWEARKPKTIVLPKHNGTCRAETPKQSEDKNCSDILSTESPYFAKLTTKRDCLFIHGVGVKHSGQYKTEKSYPDYWGNIERETPQCKSHKFIVMDTINYGWDNNILHKNFCNFTGGINRTIRNKVIFSHSMGNLIVAASLFKKVCTFDSDSSKWYSIQAPWKGSKAADFLDRLCSGSFKGNIGTFLTKVVSKVLISLNFCTKSGKSISAFDSLKTNYQSPFNISRNNLIDAAKMYTGGAMCGDSSKGLWKSWLWSTVFKFVQAFVHLERPNDGVVSYDSCDITGNFKDTFRNTFFKTRANHFEGTCRFGEINWAPPGWKMDRPCGWYTQRDV